MIQEIFTGVLGFLLVCGAIFLVVVWAVFPFLVLSRLKEQTRALQQIEKHAKAQAEFWEGRNVVVDR
jgi:hypothetical protein